VFLSSFFCRNEEEVKEEDKEESVLEGMMKYIDKFYGKVGDKYKIHARVVTIKFSRDSNVIGEKANDIFQLSKKFTF
jgi:hypothetical protein